MHHNAPRRALRRRRAVRGGRDVRLAVLLDIHVGLGACVRVGFFIRGTVAHRLRLRWLAHATFRCQRACLRLD